MRGIQARFHYVSKIFKNVEKRNSFQSKVFKEISDNYMLILVDYLNNI